MKRLSTRVNTLEEAISFDEDSQQILDVLRPRWQAGEFRDYGDWSPEQGADALLALGFAHHAATNENPLDSEYEFFEVVCRGISPEFL
jgi:hypothetical protein